MWRRTYLGLILLRLYLAVSPSYLHPDEHFQGPEVIAGSVFGFPHKLTWEFTAAAPIRSIYPIWLIYGWPLTIFKWVWDGIGYGDVHPELVYYALRLVMFAMSFILQDWALHELLPGPRQRRLGILLVASSYVTWTWQSHTFSNSIETIAVLWSLVFIQRIQEDKKSSQLMYSSLVGFLAVFGTFNRITFPAFLVIPLLRMIPHFRVKPWCLVAMIASGLFNLAFAILLDTEWYTSGQTSIRHFISHAVITPINNLAYNLDSSNLAQHGLHPFYQHILANLPQLIGPAYLLLFLSPRRGNLLYSAASAVLLLSCFKHQEARFLVPAVPLLLASVNIPPSWTKVFFTIWIIFNSILGLLMGIFHQGGVVPAQLWIGHQSTVTQTFWWRTHSPPIYLLGREGSDVVTHDLMGRPGINMTSYVTEHVACDATSESLLVAPTSAIYLDQFLERKYLDRDGLPFTLTKKWEYSRHLNLDDLDFGDDGIWPTLTRVIGRRGLGIWKINRQC
ncbi:glycosyltransferase family 22 protein [Myriangium duriaei CBS 260.36]|uniref:Mannosyltransferase n=1 Tax=Myriangium duriaei CBS 260.36 TaxID=1168546 RepID=A0A9P4IWF8_9PEZI|nr:glycosyltransferase family 22 protein [Myriangium duriaei CBS 260.36]